MSREIKFRAWLPFSDDMKDHMRINSEPVLEGKFLYTEYRELKRDAGFIAHDDLIQLLEMSNPPTLVWEQYTGLKDKSGVEIYESDVIEADGGHYVIEWRDAAFIRRALFLLSGDSRKVFPIDPVYTLYESEGLERAGIIGNIHESPELLEVSQ